jgi:hypothetical protein
MNVGYHVSAEKVKERNIMEGVRIRKQPSSKTSIIIPLIPALKARKSN